VWQIKWNLCQTEDILPSVDTETHLLEGRDPRPILGQASKDAMDTLLPGIKAQFPQQATPYGYGFPRRRQGRGQVDHIGFGALSPHAHLSEACYPSALLYLIIHTGEDLCAR